MKNRYPCKVSVLCATFNHEDYLRTTLDGFLAQKTNFPYEVLVCDDASTDSTADILREYAEKHHLPILLHTWGREPEPLRAIAPRYPHAKFIIGHSGGSDAGRRLSGELALLSPNIHLDFYAAFCSTLPWYKYAEKIDKSRLHFGSDAGPHNEAYELGAFLSMPVPDAELVPILAESFDRILADRV